MFIYSSLKGKAQGFLDKYKEKDTASYAAAEQAIGGLLILDGFIGIDNPLGGKKRSGIFGTVTSMFIGVIFIFLPVIFGSISGINIIHKPHQLVTQATAAKPLVVLSLSTTIQMIQIRGLQT